MKRILLLIISVCLLFFNGFSQSSGTYTAKKTNSHIIKTKSKYIPKIEKGFYIRPELSSTIILNYHYLNFSLFMDVGYQFNPYFLLGLGGGTQYMSSYYMEVQKGAFNVPIFGFMRVNVFTSNHGITPFFEIKFGQVLKVVLGENTEYHRDYYFNYNKFDNSGPFITLGIGFIKNNFQLKSSFVLSIINRYFDNNYYYKKNDYITGGISLSLAYNIPFKKHK